jgi:hypothetical protein
MKVRRHRHLELRVGLGMELWRAVVQDLFPQQSRDVTQLWPLVLQTLNVTQLWPLVLQTLNVMEEAYHPDH